MEEGLLAFHYLKLKNINYANDNACWCIGLYASGDHENEEFLLSKYFGIYTFVVLY